MQGEKESLTLLYYPPKEPGQEPVTLIELGPSTNACPQGLCMYNVNANANRWNLHISAFPYFFPVMVHMTCKRTKNAKEDLAYVVNKFLRAEQLDPNTARSSSDCHTQTVSPDKRHLQVIVEDLECYQISLYHAARSI
jgi:hypothetical protein